MWQRNLKIEFAHFGLIHCFDKCLNMTNLLKTLVNHFHQIYTFEKMKAI